MTAFEYLEKYVVSIIKPSRIGGVGFFAVRDILKDELVFETWSGNTGVYSITQEELHQLPLDLQKNIYETFDNKFAYIDNHGEKIQIQKTYGKLFFPLNKNCHWIYVWPKMFINSGLNNANVDTNSWYPRAIRDIKKGEELLGNYGQNFKMIPKNFI